MARTYRQCKIESLNSAPPEYVSDDEQDLATERRLRARYPLLCQRFLDGFTVEQCARAAGLSLADVKIRLARELRRAERDPVTRTGLGHALVTMSRRRPE